jgi:hypothetical protein
VPSPDYPLWTASVTLNQGRAVHYPCRPRTASSARPGRASRADHAAHARDRRHQPQQSDRRGVQRGEGAGPSRLAEKHRLILFSDEIYDQMTYDGARVRAAGDHWSTTRCARPSAACRRSTAPAAIGSAGCRSAASHASSQDYLQASTCSPRCACAATCRGSGRCRPRSAATRASRNWCGRAGGCTSRAA